MTSELFRDGSYSFIGWLPLLGLVDNFFPNNNTFHTISFITFCNENNFYDHFKNVTGFLIEINTSCACMLMKMAAETDQEVGVGCIYLEK